MKHTLQSRISALACAVAIFGFAAAPAAAQETPFHISADPATMMAPTAEQIAAAIPMEQFLEPGATSAMGPMSASEGAPAHAAGDFGRAIRGALAEDFPEVSGEPGMAPQNYGEASANTVFHYNDYRQDALWAYPWRTAGKLFFTFDGQSWFSCTASLIGRGHIVTAGHCLHEGGNGAAGWYQQAYFVPAYDSAQAINRQRFGRCNITYATTTWGWYNDGAIGEGYDVAVAACGTLYEARFNRYNGTVPGGRLGWMGFCYANCTLGYHFLTQLGYPGNYYSGGQMTTSQHVSLTAIEGPLGYQGPDYHYGTGMRGGSSGGPHVQNIGFIEDNSTDLGERTSRNIVYAVTSWGYIAHNWKLQGASPLSGPNNTNLFPTMYNQTCTHLRNNFGRWMCDFLPT